MDASCTRGLQARSGRSPVRVRFPPGPARQDSAICSTSRAAKRRCLPRNRHGTARAADNTTTPCGFHFTHHDPAGAAARYQHCGNSFILIKIDRRHAPGNTACVGPWSSHPFFQYGEDAVVNAYYIPTRPRLLVLDDRTICSLTQPQV
ncbi:DUF6355 family natural product biosynthesis protein [Actinosynnema sp. NPDC020468]|uniref:DUF6355 family natural product biosynthesis protein n=1 Tax=Actinosynnema sp. NPDC020468 TaxID=3154488 RepID=UPI0033F4ABE0